LHSINHLIKVSTSAVEFSSMKPSFLRVSLLAASYFVATQASAVDYARQIAPILNSKCAECHSEKRGKTKGDFAIDRKEDLEKQVKAGSPDASSLVVTVTLPDDDDDVMPPKGKNRLTKVEVETLRKWIEEGANFVAGAAPAAPGAAPAAAGAAMAWTNTAGKSLQAVFDRIEGDNVVLRAADGKFYAVPMASLSPESQAQAKKAGGM
jgi:mono/diheme cytochrome c family protein